MDQVQIQAVKDLLHLLVDKLEAPVLTDLLSKLPPQYAGLAQALMAAILPVAIEAQDKAIDGIA